MSNNKNRPLGHSNTLVQHSSRLIPWVWEGVLALEAVTLLSGPEKVGKTTLLSLLLDRRRAGGLLLGRTVYPGKTILCSEEHERLWTLRQPPLDFGPDLIFHRPLAGCPTRGRWNRFIDDLCELAHGQDPFDLLVIDTAVNFLPLAGRNQRTLRWALDQLRLVAGFPAGVLVLNQSRTVHRPLAAFADIVIRIDLPRPHALLSPSRTGAGLEGTRRRLFTGVGRYPETLPGVAAELNPDGSDYVLVEDSPPPHRLLLPTLQTLLRESATPLSRREILARWPGAAPREDTLWRTLTRGCETGLFARSGTGTKTDAFRYALARQGEQAEPAGGPGTNS
jgi:hypothetical protein